MTMKYLDKNVSAETDEIVVTNAQLSNGILTFSRKNFYDDGDNSDYTIKVDLKDIKLRIYKLKKGESIDDYKGDSISDEKKLKRETHLFLEPVNNNDNDHETEGIYHEYIWDEERKDFEMLGSTYLNLEPLEGRMDNAEAAIKNKVDKESGKSLIETSKIAKLDRIQDEANKTIVDTEIKTSNNPVSNTAIKNALSNKVDKETGKGLMTDAERIKLNDIETEANKTIVDTEIKTSNNPVSNTAIKNALDNLTNTISTNGSNIYEITDNMVKGDNITIDTNDTVFFIYSKKVYTASTYFRINNKPCVDNVNGGSFERITPDSLYLIMSLNVAFAVSPITNGLISDNLKSKISDLNVVDVIEDGNSGVTTSNAVNDAIQALSNNMELTTLDITYTDGHTDQISFYTKPKTSNGG